MPDRLRHSWALVQASWGVLRADRELLIYPIVSFLASLVVLATFLAPMLLAGVFDSAVGVEIIGPIVGFVFYVVMYFVTIFANAALVGATMIRLKGGNPTLADGFRIAWQHLTSILGYAVIAATVGMVLRALSERGGVVGRTVAGLVGMAWGLATFLVVPILVMEDVGPLEAVKRSARLLKETWSEQIVGNLSIGLIFGLLAVGVILVGVILIIILARAQSVAGLIAVGVSLVVALSAIALVGTTLSGIYAAAVYRFATTGDAGGYFDVDMIKGAFKPA